MEYKTAAGYIRRGTPQDQWLVDESKKDRWMADVASWIRHIHELYVFVVNGKAVGYVLPRHEPDGYWRTGSIYLIPSVRSFDAIKRFTGDFLTQKKSLNFGLDLEMGVAA